MSILVGYAQNSITPTLTRPVFLAGFDRNRRAEGIHDDLSVRVLAMQDQTQCLALVALDLIGVGRKFYLRCQDETAKALPGLCLVITCTHTHHGPDTIGLWGPDESTRGVDPAYMAFLHKQVVDTVKQAFSALAPALLRAASVQAPGVVKNARDPAILDQQLTCLQFVDPDSNQALVTLLNFPCHPETLWDGNPLITADYPHYLREQVHCLTHAACIFISGALGGMMTPDVSDHSFAEAEQIGSVLAHAGVNSLNRQLPFSPEQFQYQRVDCSIPLNSPLLERALQDHLLEDAQIAAGIINTEVGLLRLGDAWLAHVPGELLPKLGLQLKKEMRTAGASVCGILGLANDEIGYILPDEAYQYPLNPFDPGDYYEETMSVGPIAGSCVTTAVTSLILSNAS